MSLRPILFFRASIGLAFFVALLAVIAARGFAQNGPLAVIAATTNAPVIAGGEELRAPDLVREFYEERGFRAAWEGKKGAKRLAQLISAIGRSADQGLDPADYHQSTLLAAADREDVETADLLATDAFLALASDIRDGRLDPALFSPGMARASRGGGLVALLANAIENGRIEEALAALEPASADYRILKEALALYRKAAAGGGWAAVEQGPDLALGAEGARVAALRLRLAATGLLSGPEEQDAALFDKTVQTAVAAFQHRAGLNPSGVVDAQTLSELNEPPEARIATIRANLERWRWTPEELGRRHIRVNVAEFRLEAREDGRIIETHDIIAGRPSRETPSFSDEMTYVIFNPWWETPPNLARLDELPQFQRDPGAVKRLGFDVYDETGQRLDPDAIDWKSYTSSNFPFRLRQKPGPYNALGQVKMMFPNPYNVYLHDTPAKQLFDQPERAYSSGCIRVRDALGLARWALAETPGFGQAEIDKIVAAGKERRADLTEPLPVHIFYFSVVADADGSFRFVGDVYHRDAAVGAALESPPDRIESKSN